MEAEHSDSMAQALARAPRHLGRARTRGGSHIAKQEGREGRTGREPGFCDNSLSRSNHENDLCSFEGTHPGVSRQVPPPPITRGPSSQHRTLCGDKQQRHHGSTLAKTVALLSLRHVAREWWVRQRGGDGRAGSQERAARRVQPGEQPGEKGPGSWWAEARVQEEQTRGQGLGGRKPREGTWVFRSSREGAQEEAGVGALQRAAEPGAGCG